MHADLAAHVGGDLSRAEQGAVREHRQYVPGQRLLDLRVRARGRAEVVVPAEQVGGPAAGTASRSRCTPASAATRARPRRWRSSSGSATAPAPAAPSPAVIPRRNGRRCWTRARRAPIRIPGGPPVTYAEIVTATVKLLADPPQSWSALARRLQQLYQASTPAAAAPPPPPRLRGGSGLRQHGRGAGRRHLHRHQQPPRPLPLARRGPVARPPLRSVRILLGLPVRAVRHLASARP